MFRRAREATPTQECTRIKILTMNNVQTDILSSSATDAESAVSTNVGYDDVSVVIGFRLYFGRNLVVWQKFKSFVYSQRRFSLSIFVEGRYS
ncbi:hypothetical protein J6590_025852 [Homalodisca vitripennis]|nr:hypothetical protein J6590_025852 [Homalodisca vitripennis]